jgi:hypothetical protein
MSKKKLEDMTLEEKVDELLKYQRRLHHMAVLKTVFSVLTFVILVILPLIGIYYMTDYLASSMGLSLSEIGETLQRVKHLTDLGSIDNLDNLRGFLN